MSDLYQEIIIEEFQNPQNFGQLKNADAILEERNSSCGDSVKIYIQLSDSAKSADPANQKIIDLRWEGEGCAIGMAAMSVLSAKIRHDQPTLSEIQKLTQKDIEDLLGLETLSMGRVKCLMLGLNALKKFATEKLS